jgi:ABC-type nitrate/sulfonate/bicarbonate transport system substrate-binding protein
VWHHIAMSLTQLRVGTFTRSVLLEVARGDGIFRDAGIEIEESSVTSSPAQFESLEAGEFDLVFTGPDNVLAYRFVTDNPLGRLLPVEILGAVDRGLGLGLYLGPDVASIEHVRGEVVGVDVATSGFAFVAYELLARGGLAPGDYQVRALGSTPRRAAALVAGECAATVLNAGNELGAQSHGCTAVGTVTEIGPYLGTVVAALTTDDPATIDVRQRFRDCLSETARRIVAGEREPQVIAAATSLLGLDEEQARAHHACVRSKVTGLTPDGLVDRAAMATVVELRRRFLATSDLDGVMDALDQFIAEGALA